MASGQRKGSPYWLVLRIPTVLWLCVSGALHNFNMYALNSFLTAFLSRFHQMGLREANNVSSIVLGAVGVAGLLAGGWAADRLSRVRPDGRLLLSSLALLVAAPLNYWSLGMPSGAMYVIPVLCAILAAVLFAASRTVSADMKRMDNTTSFVGHEHQPKKK